PHHRPTSAPSRKGYASRRLDRRTPINILRATSAQQPNSRLGILDMNQREAPRLHEGINLGNGCRLVRITAKPVAKVVLKIHPTIGLVVGAVFPGVISLQQ